MDSLLAPECIALDVAASGKDDLFTEIARQVHARYKLSRAEVVSRLWRRERRSGCSSTTC